MKTSPHRLWLAVLVGYFLTVLSSPPSLAAVPDQTQRIPLNYGWNLISIQVEGPSVQKGFAATFVKTNLFDANGAQAASALEAIWGFDNTARTWSSYQPGVAAYPHDLSEVQPGKGYWIKVNQACTLNLTGPPWEGAPAISVGWNLVGFGGLNSPGGGVELVNVFREQLANVQQVWTFRSESGGQNYLGYDDSARPPRRDLATLDPGRAYWVFALQSLPSLAAQAAVTLDPDLDRNPNNPVRPAIVGDADRAAVKDLNGNDIADNSYTQDTILFDLGENQKSVGIQITNGLGVANWYALESIPWLGFKTAPSDANAAEMSAELLSAQAGRLRRFSTNYVQGVVAVNPAHITLVVDRTGLVPGTTYSNTFSVWAGGNERLIKVRLKMPGPEGDYTGLAATKYVNGKSIPLGKIDLSLSLFRNSNGAAGERGFRGVINSARSLLFPRDVFMDGAFYSDTEFVLSSNFEVPAGDYNAPPFNTFKGGQNAGATGFGDVDVRTNGTFENLNPFAFTIRREVSIVGKYLDDNSVAGTYYESIQDLLPKGEKILIQGDFHMNRLTIQPTLTTIFNQNVVTNVIVGGSSGDNTYRASVSVSNVFSVEGISGAFNLDYAAAAGLDVTLVNGTNRVGLLSVAGGTTGLQSFTSTNLNGQPGAGEWTLEVKWTGSPERGRFYGWNLNLQGIASFSVTGRVERVSGAATVPLPGALVILSGNNIMRQTVAGADGGFSFAGLTENDFTLFLNAPGYQPRYRNFALSDRNVDLGSTVLNAVSNATSVLLTAPGMGGQMLYTELTPVVTAADLTALGTITGSAWNFGDGSSASVTGAALLATNHVYTNAGYYSAVLTVSGSGGSLVLSNSIAVVAQGYLPTAQTAAFNLVSAGFIGAIAASTTAGNIGFDHTGSASSTNQTVVTNGVTTVFATTQAYNYQESKRDVAAFDIDRFPFGPALGGSSPFPGLEDTDYRPTNGEAGYFSYSPSPVNGIPYVDRFRLVCTFGGYVFGTAPAVFVDPSKSADLKLQVGRIED